MRTKLNRNRIEGFVPAALTEVDNVFDQFFGGEGFRPTSSWRAPASIWEADEKFHIELDTPGVKQEDVELTFEKGTLKIAVERAVPEGERKHWHNERAFGKVVRHLSLPESADADSIEAELNAGVLHVTIAKTPEAQPKRIDVKSAG